MLIRKLERQRALVTLTESELCGYGVSFSRMRLDEPHTRALLRDLFSMLDELGLGCQTRPVSVECAPSPDGGCALLIGAPEQEGQVSFLSCDDLLDAGLAGVIPEDCFVSNSEGGWSLFCARPLSDDELALLSEFSE